MVRLRLCIKFNISLNVEKFHNQLKNNNLYINKITLIEKLDLIKRIKEIKKNKPIESNFKYPNNFYSKFFVNDIKNNEFIFFVKRSDNLMEISTCNFNLSVCENDKISFENFKFLLEQKNENFYSEKLFISNDLINIKMEFLTEVQKIWEIFKEFSYDNINILSNQFVDHNIDFENKIIEINYFEAEGRVIIHNSKLQDFTIRFHNNFENLKSKETNFFGITGCLLISDSYVDNVVIEAVLRVKTRLTSWELVEILSY